MPATYGYPLGFLVFFAFVVGACVGSFLNVVIARVPYGDSVVWPPSHCMSCGTAIKPFHNVPILSWFVLRGRCRTCLAPFSIRYAVIEAAFGVVCGFAVLRHGLSLPALQEVALMGFLVPLSAMDLDHWILPRELTWPGVVVGLSLALVAGAGEAAGIEGEGAWAAGRALLASPFGDRLLAAALGYTSLLLVGFIGERVFHKDAMGGGDTVLLALIGAFLGTRALLPVILLSSVQAVAVGYPLMLLRRRGVSEEPSEPEAESDPTVDPAVEPKADEDDDDWEPDPHHVPYGPFLSLAAAEILYFTHLPDVLFPMRLSWLFG